MKLAYNLQIWRSIRTLSILLIASIISACTTISPSEQANSNTSNTSSVSKNQPSTSIIIPSRSSKAILEDIIKYRSDKGMKIRSRGNQRVEMMMPMSNTSIPTEARMQYILTQTEQGWRVNVRVFQISNPGSKQETVQEITQALADKLAEELALYAKIATKR
ncbi:hypothetical protein [Deefgea piscis]|uniref:hypothetical protein n=1 Tax=Deefgea piscis TaxID=2739061 RepID=UPI001C800BB3|nr:hypothetical protein [Deefgea piscis]QZA80526.1 hypothetical protein K4H25_13545 [Deefgea piscis]